MKPTKVHTLAAVAMNAAIIAILSQIALPSPTGVPFTLQTFAVALTGYLLLPKLSFYTVLLYLLIGAAGMPVFANLRGGLPHLVGLTGGFLWGYLFYAPLCSLGLQKRSQKHKGTRPEIKNTLTAIICGITGLLICHALGVLQYALLTAGSFKTALLLVSLPYLLKDMICVAAAYMVAKKVRKRAMHFICITL